VDDVDTNIFVAQGLLSPYALKVDTANSGFGAIEHVKGGKSYDIIFMDHMMPKLDGVETTKRLRAMGYAKPIVALTANAVAGQDGIFLANGFDDYISKPIDVRQLNAVLNRLVRDVYPPEMVESARRQAGTETAAPSAPGRIDPALAKVFVRDAIKSIAALDDFLQNTGACGEEGIRTFTIHAHGIKSALANIGMMALSAVAMRLEELGRTGDTEAILAETPAFLQALRAAVREIAPREEAAAETETAAEDMDFLREKLLLVKTACEAYDADAAEEALAELSGTAWPSEAKDLLDAIGELLLHSDFEEIVEAIDGFV
jgi:CheY-like chemotaxis protein